MTKNLIIGALLVVVAGLGYLMYSEEAQAPTTPNDEEEICIQVITPARNPETGEIREFPTPCDVPPGWEVIQNDVPGLYLEVQ